MLDVARQLDGQRAARATHAEVTVVRRAALEDDRHASQRNDVVDDGGLAEQALDGRQRRAVTHLGPLAFQALEQRGFLAADVGAGAHAHFELERLAAAADVGPEIAALHAPSRWLRAAHVRHAGIRSAGRCSPAWHRRRRRRWSCLRSGRADRLPSACDPRTCRSRLRPHCRRRTSAATCWSSTVFHLMPVGNAAPPRPRRPESSHFLHDLQRQTCPAHACRPAKPPCAT